MGALSGSSRPSDALESFSRHAPAFLYSRAGQKTVDLCLSATGGTRPARDNRDWAGNVRSTANRRRSAILATTSSDHRLVTSRGDPMRSGVAATVVTIPCGRVSRRAARRRDRGSVLRKRAAKAPNARKGRQRAVGAWRGRQ